MIPPSTGQLTILLIINMLAECGVLGDLLEGLPREDSVEGELLEGLPREDSAQKVPNSLPREGSGR